MLVYYSSVEIKNCIFRNFYTPLYGGLFYMHFPYSFTADHIDVYNITAMYGGSLNYAYSTGNLVDINFNNVNVYGAGLSGNTMTYGGLLADIRGNFNLNISNFYGEDLHERDCVGIFLMVYNTNIYIENIELHKIYAAQYSAVLVYSTDNQHNKDFHMTNGTITDVYQDITNPESVTVASAMIMASQDINISLKNCVFENLNFYSTIFIFTILKSNIILNNVYVDGYHLIRETNFMWVVNSNDESSYVLLEDVTVKNANLNSLVISEHADITLKNTTYSNNCDKVTNCPNVGAIINFETTLETYNNINIMDSTFYNLQGEFGFPATDRVNYNIVNSEFKNCYYEHGLFDIKYDYNTTIVIENSYFKNNYGENGPIFYVEYVGKKYDNDITINDSIFEENYA
eukprot:jgi/Orpsp1_1/1190730/evm.model.d7180000080827.1